MAVRYPESEELLGSAEHLRRIEFSDHPGLAAFPPNLCRANDVHWTDVVGGIDNRVYLGRVFRQMRSGWRPD